jgi:hypothetical protein
MQTIAYLRISQDSQASIAKITGVDRATLYHCLSSRHRG